MEPILEFLFKALSAKISTKVPEIKHIDWFNDQYGKTVSGNDYFGYRKRSVREANELPFSRPAVLLEFKRINTSGDTNIQGLSILLAVHILSDNWAEGRKDSLDQNTFLDRFRLVATVSESLHRFFQFPLTSCTRKEIKLDHNQSQLTADIIYFELTLAEILKNFPPKTTPSGLLLKLV